MLTTAILGDRIAHARKKVNLSQSQLAGQLFISPQAVGKWERGESMPDIITFNRMAEILGVDLNYFSESFPSLTDGTGDNPVAPAESVPGPGEETQSGKPEKKPVWDMSGGNWVDADFSGLKNLHEKFSSSNMQRCRFVGSELSGLLLKRNNVEKCDFSGSDISGSNIQHSNLSKNQFISCSLREAAFSGSNVEGCDFSGADFSGVSFRSAAFGSNSLENSIWNRSSFISSHIDNIVFGGTLEECSFENCAFSRTKFVNATLLNTFFKNNKKLKRVQFIDCRADKLTLAFLKNGNADLKRISLLEG
ncbi:MAG: pentapeptide repeat-containing protein [Bacteroidales bacterium]|nr:pentapeptide repeat-containing protein [Bacteroidales bacterium]